MAAAEDAKDFAAGMGAQLLSSFAYVPRDIIVERCAIDGQRPAADLGAPAVPL